MRLIAGAALCIGLAGCSTLPSDSVSTDSGPAPRCDRSVPWTYAAAGREIFCGVHADGCAECWGDEPVADTGWDTGGGFFDRGQFEVPDLEFVMVAVMQSPEGAAQNDEACGLTVDGAAVCWGRELSTFADTYTAVRLDDWGPCALTAGWGVACPGEPVRTHDFPLDTTVFDIAGFLVGALHSDGALWLGLYAPGFNLVEREDVEYSSMDVVANDLGLGLGPAFVVCAIRDADSSIACWNAVTVGGSDETIDTVPPGAYTTVCLTADDHACALDEAGYPTCWGDGPMGEPVEPLSQLSCGYSDACGVTFDGRLLCWGACDHGECDVPG